jgi:hypothetical protein
MAMCLSILGIAGGVAVLVVLVIDVNRLVRNPHLSIGVLVTIIVCEGLGLAFAVGERRATKKMEKLEEARRALASEVAGSRGAAQDAGS